MKKPLLLLALCLVAMPARAAAPSVEQPIAVLRALDKVTARVEQIEVQTERPYKFGTIFITVHSCRVTTPEEQPEAAAFLEVGEFKTGQDQSTVFKGWMFASSPALSAMEHPVYDLWVIGCKDPAAPVPSAAPVPPAAGEAGATQPGAPAAAPAAAAPSTPAKPAAPSSTVPPPAKKGT